MLISFFNLINLRCSFPQSFAGFLLFIYTGSQTSPVSICLLRCCCCCCCCCCWCCCFVFVFCLFVFCLFLFCLNFCFVLFLFLLLFVCFFVSLFVCLFFRATQKQELVLFTLLFNFLYLRHGNINACGGGWVVVWLKLHAEMGERKILYNYCLCKERSCQPNIAFRKKIRHYFMFPGITDLERRYGDVRHA